MTVEIKLIFVKKKKKGVMFSLLNKYTDDERGMYTYHPLLNKKVKTLLFVC